METGNIAQLVTAVGGGLAAMVPLVKIISKWHIEWKRISPPVANATNIQIQTAKRDDQCKNMDRVALCGMISGLVAGLCGMGMLYDLMVFTSGPVTMPGFAKTVAAVLYIYLGWIRQQPWN